MSRRKRYKKKNGIGTAAIILLVVMVISGIAQLWPIVIMLVVALIAIGIAYFVIKNNNDTKYRYTFGDKNYDDMNGLEFEEFIADLLRRNGFSNVNVTVASGDFGIDVLACKDGKKYALQCKCYSAKVGNHAVQEAYSGSAYYKCDQPVVVTNNYFTNAAKKEAQTLKVLLWDRDMLNHMVRNAYKKNKNNKESENVMNDSIILDCPQCEQKLRVKKTNGKMLFIHCPKCQYTFYERT